MILIPYFYCCYDDDVKEQIFESEAYFTWLMTVNERIKIKGHQ